MPHAGDRLSTSNKRGPIAAAVGVGIGLVIAIVVITNARRQPVAQPRSDAQALAGALLVEDEGAIDELVFQYTAGLEGVVAETYRDFLLALDPTTRLVAVVAKPRDSGPSDAQSLHTLLASIDADGARGLEKRTRIVETAGPITVWSKDRALIGAATKPGDRSLLLVPVRPDPRWTERSNDWATLAAVAAAIPDRYMVHELPLAYDAGDFAVTGKTVLVDVNLFEKNKGRGIADLAELRDRLARMFGRQVVVLGQNDGDLPRHHMSMYMTPLARGTVLVGDPRAGKTLVGADWQPGETSADTDEPLRADFSDAMVARFDRAAQGLSAAGFDVQRIPVVPIDDKTYVTYTNGVYETRGARSIAYVPQYAAAGAQTSDAVVKMDAIAVQVYERLGWEVRPIRVRNTYRFHGTIGCLANVLARSAAR